MLLMAQCQHPIELQPITCSHLGMAAQEFVPPSVPILDTGVQGRAAASKRDYNNEDTQSVAVYDLTNETRKGTSE